MGGRGTGFIVHMGMKDGIVQDSKAKWETVVVDYNPQAGSKDVRIKESYEAFAEIARDKHDNKIEVLAVIDEDGYVEKIANGKDGEVGFSAAMKRDMEGRHVTHYHNRRTDTPIQAKERVEDDKDYRSIERAIKRFRDADAIITRIEKGDGESMSRERKSKILTDWVGSDDNKAVQKWLERSDISDESKTKVIALKKAIDDDENEWRLAWRRKRAAAKDIEDRIYDYTGTRQSINSWGHGEDIKKPKKKYDTPDEYGFIGGCPSLADFLNAPFDGNILSFAATCEEGNYQIRGTRRANIIQMRGEMLNLWDTDSQGNPKGEEAKRFQGALKTIDRKTNKEGEQQGWSKQKRRAVSFNRQMTYIWEESKKILEANGFIATFDNNPKYKPVFKEGLK